MSHPSVIKFFEEALLAVRSALPVHPRVLEIGSYDVNGSVRGIVAKTVQPSEHVGVDLIPGPGVDIVSSGDDVDAPPASFDLVVSAECLEHNPRYAQTLLAMRRLVKPQGYVIVSCASPGRLEHGTTRTNPKSSPGTQAQGWDYYKNLTAQDFPRAFCESFNAHRFWENRYSRDLYFVGSVSGAVPLGDTLECLTIKPSAGLANFLTLQLPLNTMRAVLPEHLYQDAGCAFVRARMKLGRTLHGPT